MLKCEFWKQPETAILPAGGNLTLAAEADDRAFKEAYALIIAALIESRRVARLFTSLFYGVGMVAFGLVIFENVKYVLEHW